MQADLTIIPNTQCAPKYAPRITIGSTHLCAGGGTSDTCSGDSGGPAIFPGTTPNGPRYIQFGVVSAGPSNCDPSANVPGIYTRVIPFMQWILDTMQP